MGSEGRKKREYTLRKEESAGKWEKRGRGLNEAKEADGNE